MEDLMARTGDTEVVFAALCVADPDVMDRDEIAVFIKQVASLKAWCDSLNVRATRRQRRLAAEGRAEAPKDLLACEGGQSGKDARAGENASGCARRYRASKRRSPLARCRPGMSMRSRGRSATSTRRS